MHKEGGLTFDRRERNDMERYIEREKDREKIGI